MFWTVYMAIKKENPLKANNLQGINGFESDPARFDLAT